MDRGINIHKKAFIARVNEMRKRAVVDTRYNVTDESQKLMLVFEDGHEETFEGLHIA